jgi:hypothetical protein
LMVRVGLGWRGCWWGFGIRECRRRAVALTRDAHLIDDKAVAKMGHPAFVEPLRDV